MGHRVFQWVPCRRCPVSVHWDCLPLFLPPTRGVKWGKYWALREEMKAKAKKHKSGQKAKAEPLHGPALNHPVLKDGNGDAGDKFGCGYDCKRVWAAMRLDLANEEQLEWARRWHRPQAPNLHVFAERKNACFPGLNDRVDNGQMTQSIQEVARTFMFCWKHEVSQSGEAVARHAGDLFSGEDGARWLELVDAFEVGRVGRRRKTLHASRRAKVVPSGIR